MIDVLRSGFMASLRDRCNADQMLRGRDCPTMIRHGVGRTGALLTSPDVVSFRADGLSGQCLGLVDCRPVDAMREAVNQWCCDRASISHQDSAFVLKTARSRILSKSSVPCKKVSLFSHFRREVRLLAAGLWLPVVRRSDRFAGLSCSFYIWLARS